MDPNKRELLPWPPPSLYLPTSVCLVPTQGRPSSRGWGAVTRPIPLPPGGVRPQTITEGNKMISLLGDCCERNGVSGGEITRDELFQAGRTGEVSQRDQSDRRGQAGEESCGEGRAAKALWKQ